MPSSKRSLVGCKTRCKSQFCQDCALAHCVKWREALRPALSCWTSVIMLTLTVDPANYETPEAAYLDVGKRRAVSKLIAKLLRRKMIRSKEFTCTIEFHKSGWPHYHVLVDSSFVEKHELQKCWGLGHCWFSRHKFKTIAHAINYATKYISKTSKDDENEFWFPDWVLDFKGNMRRFSVSREISSRIRGGKPSKRKKTDGKKRGRVRKSGRQRSEL